MLTVAAGILERKSKIFVSLVLSFTVVVVDDDDDFALFFAHH